MDTGLAPTLDVAQSCTRCGRAREHVALIEVAQRLLVWVNEGGPVEPDSRTLEPLRAAVRGYQLGPPARGASSVVDEWLAQGAERIERTDVHAEVWAAFLAPCGWPIEDDVLTDEGDHREPVPALMPLASAISVAVEWSAPDAARTPIEISFAELVPGEVNGVGGRAPPVLGAAVLP